MSKEICGNFDEFDVTCSDCIRNRVQRLNACYESVKREKPTTEKENKMSEKINTDKINPSHYQNENGRQAIDEMRLLFGDADVKGFCRCNYYKYMSRAERKENESAETDKAKALWYLDYLETMEKGE